MVEQRYQAVLSVIGDGLSVKVAADKVGVSRQTLHSWMATERPPVFGAWATPRFLSKGRHHPCLCEVASAWLGVLTSLNWRAGPLGPG